MNDISDADELTTPIAEVVHSLLGYIGDLVKLVGMLTPSGVVNEAKRTLSAAYEVADLRHQRKQIHIVEDIAQLLRDLKFQPNGIRQVVIDFLLTDDIQERLKLWAKFEERAVSNLELINKTVSIARSDAHTVARNKELIDTVSAVTDWKGQVFYRTFALTQREALSELRVTSKDERTKEAESLNEKFEEMNKIIDEALQSIEAVLLKNDARARPSKGR